MESETNNKIKINAEDGLKKKSKLRKEFIFKTIKSCYGKGNWIGGQGKVLKNNLLLLEEITSKYLNK
jgi:hypothetical protein